MSKTVIKTLNSNYKHSCTTALSPIFGRDMKKRGSSKGESRISVMENTSRKQIGIQRNLGIKRMSPILALSINTYRIGL